jgi:hypothetical protein
MQLSTGTPRTRELIVEESLFYLCLQFLSIHVFQPDLGEIIRQDLGETSINMEGKRRNGVEATI